MRPELAGSSSDSAIRLMADKEPRETRLTEQRNPRTAGIDRLTPLEIVGVINAEDRKIAPAVHAAREPIARAIELAEASLRQGGRLIYVGAGTSGRLGVLDASEMPPTFGTDPELVQGVIAGGPAALTQAAEGAEDRPADGAAAMDERGVGPRDFVLGIAASGTTPFVHGALIRAKERGARTGFLLCTPPAPEYLERYDVVIAVLVGPEAVTGSTRMKAGTATKMVLNIISTGAMILLGKVFENLMVDLRATNHKLTDRSERMLMEVLDLDREAARHLLGSAGGNVKTAIAMYWTGSDPETARRRLHDAGDRLDDFRDEARAS
jgi:N-acetylmuramic acid 6-phosphate etherase